MNRILIVGISGAGKTLLAQRIAERTGLPHVEVDALYHGPGWVPRPSFVEEITQLAAGDCWVLDSFGYPEVRELLWSRADTVLWLDLPRWLVEWQVVRRSVGRFLRGDRLWNGERERVRQWFTDPTHPVRWAWTEYERRWQDIAQFAQDPRFRATPVERLRTRREARAFLSRVGSPSASG